MEDTTYETFLALLHCPGAVLGFWPGSAPAVTAESPVVLGKAGDESCYGTLALPNGNLILSLTTTGGLDGGPEFGGGIRKVWLLCLAPDGSTVWETTFGENKKGGYTTLLHLALHDDGTFSGRVRYTLSQYPQYWQELTFSCADGTLLKAGDQVPDTMVEEKIYKTYFQSGEYTLLREVHDCEATCDPCILTLLGPDGAALWQLNAGGIGLSYLEGWLSTPYGAILYGKNHASESAESQAAALLVGPDGKVVWYRQAADVQDASLLDGLVDGDGRFVAVGFARGAQTYTYDPYTLGFEAFSQLLVCWDAATGEPVWQKANELTDRQLPYAHITAYDGQYVLCDSDIGYSGIVLETLAKDGTELQYWTDAFPGYTHFTPWFFTWDGELWTRTTIEVSDMDIALQRVLIP